MAIVSGVLPRGRILRGLTERLSGLGLSGVSLPLDQGELIGFTDSSVSEEENINRILQGLLPVLQKSTSDPTSSLLISQAQQKVAAPPVQAASAVQPPSLFPVGSDAPKIEDLVPREALLPAPLTETGKSFLQSMAPFPSKEEVEEARLFGQVSESEAKELEQARQLFSQEQQRLIDEDLSRQRQALVPQLEQNISRLAAQLGARGIGAGGFAGSGALQELARKGAQELEGQLFSQYAPERAQNRGLFGQLGLQAATTPSQYRQQLFGRRLERGDIAGEREFEKQLAQLGAQSSIGAARASARGQRGGVFGSLLGGGLGYAVGGPFGGLFGSQLGGSLGKLF